MNQGKYVFAQLIEFLSPNDFIRFVEKFEGNHRVRSFTCWHQMLYMIFGQLSQRESLRDLIICLQSQQNKSYHLGMGKGTSKTNLAKANEKRDYRIYENFATTLVQQVQQMSTAFEPLDLSTKAPIYAIDATVIDLCLSIFWWGKFRKHKAAVKLHVVFDVKANIPTFIDVSSGSVHEVHFLKQINFEPGSYYVMDKGFIDFERLFFINKSSAFFVMRAKANLRFVRITSRSVDKNTAVKCDQTIRLKNRLVSLAYPDNIRRIKYYDGETDAHFVFITNDFELSAVDVARIYKYRWMIELFFKWIKQHLKIKTFWGYSLNAVRTQIYIAMITYLMVAIVKHQLKLKQSQYEILQILSVSLLCKTPLLELFSNDYPQYVKELNANQLNLFDF